MNEVLAAGDLTAGTEVGPWRVLKVLGRGGTSTVYEVRSTDGFIAAAKVMRLELSSQSVVAERFVREGAIVATLGHPCIPRIFEQGELPDGRMYLVMERLRGRTLADAMSADRIALGDAAVVLDQLCGVLQTAHARGVVHRDLKPENIFLVSEAPAQLKLVDWGIAKSLGLDADQATLTRTGTIVGTPRYLAPEQARSLPVGTPADIYALGLIAYELIVGAYPFEAASIAETLMMQMVKPPPSPRRFWPAIAPALERLLLAMLSKDPARRPMLDEIRRVFAATLGERVDPATWEARTRPNSDDLATVEDSTHRPTVRALRLTRG